MTVEDWLKQHARPPAEIRLGLERVRAVCARLHPAADLPMIIVAGTNGKGSVCALLDAILRASALRVGCYTSPHLLRFGERARIGGAETPDADMLRALQAVAAAAGDIPLTYFELTTLAAARVFAESRCDIAVMEVGLGGRLDAVNVFSPAVAVITNIALDHREYLGDTRDAIAVEKAGICRRNTPVIVGDDNPPASLPAAIQRHGALPRFIGRDFRAAAKGRVWHYEGARRLHNLPLPALSGAHQIQNAACALAALESLPARFWPGNGAARIGLHTADLPARAQVLPGQPATVLDVAHNAAAAAALEKFLFAMGYFPRTRAVFGMTARKDIAACAAALRPRIDRWYVARPQDGDLSAQAMAETLQKDGHAAAAYPSVAAAAAAARADSAKNDRIVVTGSFLTVADFLRNGKKCPAAAAGQ